MNLIPVELLGLLLVERVRPSLRLPVTQRWHLRVASSLLSKIFAIVAALVLFKKFSDVSLFHTSKQTPFWLAVVIGYATTTFVKYWWHRVRHSNDRLWRLHQLHHSPARIEMMTTFYKHPLEPLLYVLMHFVVLISLLGLSLEAAIVVLSLVTGGELFSHTNMQTPRWLGYLIPTPEVHRMHHVRGAHVSNFGDLVLWDMLFGTYVNPQSVPDLFGFENNKELLVYDMLMFSDVHADRCKRK